MCSVGAEGHGCTGQGGPERDHGAAHLRMGAVCVHPSTQHGESRKLVRGHLFPGGNGRFGGGTISDQCNPSGLKTALYNSVTFLII